jgi:hypothetical protein
MIVYHITPTSNIPSILIYGIDPQYSNGKDERSWYVAKHKIDWALVHISMTYDLPVGELSVCCCHVDSKDLTMFMEPGRYFSRSVIFPESTYPMIGAVSFLGDEENE